MVIRTYADVRAEIARAGVAQGAIARALGYTESGFSSVLKDTEGRPSPTWVVRLEDVLKQAKRKAGKA